MMNARTLAEAVQPFVVDFRRDLHRHPEPSMEEFRTTDKIAAALDELGIPYRRTQPTGIVGEIVGGFPGKTVGLRADIDALSILEKSGVEFASENEGFMHACGHDTHTSMLLGAVKALNSIKDELHGTIRFIFQPAEEVALGAKALIKQNVLDGLDMLFGLHIFSQSPVGLIAVGDGPSTAASDTFKITVKGVACHGAMPETGADALLAASAIVLNLQSIVSREISPMENVVVTVGTLHSGSRFNIVSGDAVMEGTVRSFDRDIHHSLPERIKRIAADTASAYRCTVDVEYDMLTEVLMNDPEATQYMYAAARQVALDPRLVIKAPKIMGGEDFADYTPFVKAGFVFLGGGGEHPQHSDYFFVEEESFKTGVAYTIQLAYNYLNEA